MTLKERQIKPRNVQFQLKQVISGDGVKHVWMKKKFLALKVFHSIICELLFFFYIHHFYTLSSFTSCWQWCLYGKGGRTEVNTGNLWLPPPAHLHCNLHTQIHCWPRQFPYHLNFRTMVISTVTPAQRDPRQPRVPVWGISGEKLSPILTARAKMAVAGSPYGQQRNSDVCAVIGGEEGRGCALIGWFWQPASRVCTASLRTAWYRLWAGQRWGRIQAMSKI